MHRIILAEEGALRVRMGGGWLREGEHQGRDDAGK
jgi:hypothetical protein